MRRRTITLAFLLVGVALALLSYFVFSAPWGADTVDNSNPRLQFGPALLVLGVILAFASAIVYELVPDRSGQRSDDGGEA